MVPRANCDGHPWCFDPIMSSCVPCHSPSQHTPFPRLYPFPVLCSLYFWACLRTDSTLGQGISFRAEGTWPGGWLLWSPSLVCCRFSPRTCSVNRSVPVSPYPGTSLPRVPVASSLQRSSKSTAPHVLGAPRGQLHPFTPVDCQSTQACVMQWTLLWSHFRDEGTKEKRWSLWATNGIRSVCCKTNCLFTFLPG